MSLNLEPTRLESTQKSLLKLLFAQKSALFINFWTAALLSFLFRYFLNLNFFVCLSARFFQPFLCNNLGASKMT